MQGRHQSLSLRIEYWQDGGVRQHETVDLQRTCENQELPLLEIYRHVNDFLNRRPDLNPQVVLTHRGRFCGDLYGEKIDIQQCQERDGYMIRITLRPLGSRRKLNDSIMRAEEELQRLKKEEEDLMKPPCLEARVDQPPSCRQQMQDATIGILYSDPLVASIDSKGTASYQWAGSVSYEHEIHKIMKTTSKKQLNVKSMAASLSNLTSMLRTPQIVWLHISCHGHFNSVSTYYLRFEREPDRHIGLLEDITVERFKAKFAEAKAKLGCLVIMACHSWKFAEAVTDYVDFVVAIDQDKKVDNKAAETFSEQFYESLISGNSYEESFDKAQKYIFNSFNPCSCDARQPGCNRDYPCRGRHQVVKCDCPELKVNKHLKNCTGSNDFASTLMEDEQDEDYRWLCCCGCSHRESKKFKWSSKEKGSRPARIPDTNARDQNEGEAQSFQMPSTYLTPVKDMFKAVELLKKEADQQSRIKPDILLVHGPKGAGKSCFVKKISEYFFERTRKNFDQTYKKWIYLDLQFYRSMLHFLSGSSLHRQGTHYRTLSQIVKYASNQKCFFVLDHCNFLALTYKEVFQHVVETHIKKELHPGSKLIMIFETDPRLSDMHKDRHVHEFVLSFEQRASIFFGLVKAPECNLSNIKHYTLEQQKLIKSINDEMKDWLPHNIKQYTTLIDERSTVVQNPQEFLNRIRQDTNNRKRHQEEIKTKSDEIRVKAKSLSEHYQIALRILCLLGKRQPGSILRIIVSKYDVSLRQLSDFIEVDEQACKQIKPLERDVILRMSSEGELRDALHHLLWIMECMVVFLMGKFQKSNQEQPFEMSPFMDLPDQSFADTQHIQFGFDNLYQDNRKTIAPLLEEMLNPASQLLDLYLPKDGSKSPLNWEGVINRNAKSFCKVVTYAPLLKHFLEDSSRASLRSQDIHISMNSLRFIKESEDLYMHSVMELAVLLVFARSEEKGDIRKQLEVIKHELGLDRGATNNNPSIRLMENYLNSFLDLQTEYFCETKLRGECNREKYMSAMGRLLQAYRRIPANRLTPKKKQRHFVDYAFALVHLIRHQDGVMPRREELAEVIRELKVFSNESTVCCLKYYECRFLELVQYKQSSSYQDYRQLQSDFQESFRNNFEGQKTAELRFSIKQQVLRLQKCFVKVLSARPFLTSGNRQLDWTERNMEPWLCSCIQELCQPRDVSRIIKHSQAFIESDVLTSTTLAETLKNECRALFLRFDVLEKNNYGLTLNLENEVRWGCEQRMGKEELSSFDFSRVGILVICGYDVSRVRDYVKPANLIIVDFKRERDESVYDCYRRNRIMETYCASFLVEFVRALLNMQGSKIESQRIEESFLLAEHASVCSVSGFLGRKFGINNYVETNRYISESRQLVVEMSAGEISSKPILVKDCSPFSSIGYREEIRQVLQTLRQANRGVLILLDGSSPMFDDIFCEIFYMLRRARLKNCVYERQLVPMNKQSWHYYVLNVSNSLSTDDIERLNNAVSFGHRIVLRRSSIKQLKQLSKFKEKPQQVNLDKSRNQRVEFAVDMCKVLETEFREHDNSKFDGNKFDDFIRDCFSSSRNSRDLFIKKVTKSLYFRKLTRNNAALPELTYRTNSELPTNTPQLSSRFSENPVRRQISASDFKRRGSNSRVQTKRSKEEKHSTEQSRIYEEERKHKSSNYPVQEHSRESNSSSEKE